MRKYRNYTDNDIKRNAEEVKSLAALLRSLGLVPRGGNYGNMKRKLQELNVNTDHWTGQGWTANQQLKDWSQYIKASSLKPHLIKERGHKCEECTNFLWNGKPITLELEHTDGDRTNNDKDNLRLLCPNCHSQTPTWRRRKS